MPGLGRGLGSLIPNSQPRPAADSNIKEGVPAAAYYSDKVFQIPVEKIISNRYQPREHFGHAEIEELAESIKAHGILQPLIVTPEQDNKHELIAGERRLRAARILDLKAVPAIVREARDQQRLELALIENIQRQDLNPIEEASAYRRLINEFNLSHDEVGERLGKSRAVISNTLRLLNLPEEIRTAVIESKITAGHARSIAGLPHLQDQLDLFHKIINEKLNVRDTELESKKVVITKHIRPVRFDPIVDDMVDALRLALGTKVAIKKHGDQGTIVVNFYSDEELNNLVKKISGV